MYKEQACATMVRRVPVSLAFHLTVLFVLVLFFFLLFSVLAFRAGLIWNSALLDPRHCILSTFSKVKLSKTKDFLIWCARD